VHEHLAEEELARYATDPESLPPERRQAIEQEAAQCPTCRTLLDFFSVVTAEDLEDPQVWGADAETVRDDDPMLAYIRRIAEEDREADELLAREGLLESPMKTAWRNLQRDKRFLTGGVVRRLAARAHEVHENEPLDAVTFADAAIVIAETLADDTYPWDAVFELRGAAWKERANALRVAGQYPAALDALTNAERAYRKLRSPGFGLASVALVRAGVLLEQDQLVEAAVWAEKAAAGFAHLGQEERRMRAVFLYGAIKYKGGDVATGVNMFVQVQEYGEAANDPRWIGRAAYAIGNCEVDRRNLGEASLQFHRALVIFREIGPDQERLATEWGLARVVLHGGDSNEAVRRLRTVAGEFEKRDMLTDGALVRLDMVEALLAGGERDQIVEIAARLFRVFKDAGVLTGALTALAYMKEAAAAGDLTSMDIDAVRTYLRRSARQPELAFRPPEEPYR
jgi:tetratricopeptide (TPR) repeat protein